MIIKASHMNRGDYVAQALGTTWKRYIVVSKTVEALSTKERRRMFQLMRRSPGCTENSVFPSIGITVGEFCVFHTLATGRQRAPREPQTTFE